MNASDPENANRATVALVESKVATVDAKVDGLRDLIISKFADLEGLPVRVSSLTERMLHAEARITQIENENDERQGWRKVTLPQILIGVVGLVIAVANIVVLINVAGN